VRHKFTIIHKDSAVIFVIKVASENAGNCVECTCAEVFEFSSRIVLEIVSVRLDIKNCILNGILVITSRFFSLSGGLFSLDLLFSGLLFSGFFLFGLSIFFSLGFFLFGLVKFFFLYSKFIFLFFFGLVSSVFNTFG